MLFDYGSWKRGHSDVVLLETRRMNDLGKFKNVLNPLLLVVWYQIFQVGSLAGAAHLLKCNTGVQRGAQSGQKPLVEQKGKSSLDFDFQYEYKTWKRGLSILYLVMEQSFTIEVSEKLPKG